MLYPGAYAPYLGFDEEEVKVICNTYNLDFTRIKQWYDGYTLGPMHSVYNPYSVMSAAHETHRRYRSYWKKTSAAEALKTYIDMDLDGLQDTIVKLIVGESVEVNTSLFKNDMETFSSKDDVLTLLIHLGYLSFEFTNDDEESEIGLARIPNKEVKIEFEGILRTARHKNLVNLVRTSDKLLQDVMTGKEDAVAKEIHDVHDSHYAPTFYNHEQSLRSVIRLACISWVDQYAKVEELPSGHGIADVVFFPKRRSPLPAVIVELKWDKDQEGAIKQIKDRKYQKTLEQLEGEIILVGVNYDSQDKTHTCKIERIQIT